jgi:hypothetical protein
MLWLPTGVDSPIELWAPGTMFVKTTTCCLLASQHRQGLETPRPSRVQNSGSVLLLSVSRVSRSTGARLGSVHSSATWESNLVHTVGMLFLAYLVHLFSFNTTPF